jgi:hypothetical protein
MVQALYRAYATGGKTVVSLDSNQSKFNTESAQGTWGDIDK